MPYADNDHMMHTGQPVADYTLSTLPAPSDWPANVPVIVTDGGGMWYSTGQMWLPIGGSAVLLQSGATVTHTGDTLDQTSTSGTNRVAYTLPSGPNGTSLLGPNGRIVVEGQVTYKNTIPTGTSRVVVRFGSGQVLRATLSTANDNTRFRTVIQNRNSTNSQIGAAQSSTSSLGSVVDAPWTGAVDTTAAVLIAAGVELGDAGNRASITECSITIIPRA